MALIEDLALLGVDVKEGMRRIMDDRSMYEALLGMFVSDMEEAAIQEADFEEGGDLKELTRRVHTIKGTAASLSITPLATSYTKMLELLRAEKPQEAKAIFTQILPAQEKIVGCIKQYR